MSTVNRENQVSSYKVQEFLRTPASQIYRSEASSF